MKKQFKAFIFDLDGTLVDSDVVVYEAFGHALAKFGHNIENVDLESIRSRAPQRVFEGFVPEERWAEAFRFLEGYGSANLKRVPAFEGIQDALRELEVRGVPMAIWTGRDAKSATEILEANGLRRFFSHIVGGCMVARNKPSPEGLLLAAAKLGIDTKHAVVVGDHAHDLEGSKQAGAYFVGAAWCPRAKADAFKGTKADCCFARVEDFTNWLRFNPGEPPAAPTPAASA